MGAYVQILEETRGIIAEFVNPKYVDAERMVFKKPTRLETMMQDLPRLFTAEQRVGWRCLTAYGVFRRIRIRW